MKFYRTSSVDTGDFARSFLIFVLILVLSFSVVIASLLSAANVLFRVPDFYRFEFDRTEVYNKLDMAISGTDLGSFFSDFMLHNKETFALTTEFEGIERELFNQSEAIMMDNIRSFLDICLIWAICTLFLVIFLIFVMRFNSMAKELRLSLNIGLIIYILSVVGLFIFFYIYNGDMILKEHMMEGEFGPDDLLQKMFDGQFVFDAAIMIFVISFIIMMVTRYIVWKLTVQKGFLSEGLKGAAK